LGAREERFSLANFLATDVVDARNVEKAIAAAEPPFAGESWLIVVLVESA
jgi:hypothetical protein